jgi:membrane associated rhomboid family serine protease/Zn-finger nucleic acid-binding protein
MDCPICRISSMRRVMAGEKEIDRCLACGALWFDYGEIRELTEGHLSVERGDTTPQGPAGGLLRKMHRQAMSLSCPRCGGPVGAIDFQMTGVPVIRCRDCRGYLAPRRSAAAIVERFRIARQNGKKLADLAGSLAGAMKRRMECRHGPVMGTTDMRIPLPVIVPLADDGPPVSSFPLVTSLLIALSLGVHILARIADATITLPGGLPGLPSGSGIQGVSFTALLIFPFLHAGLVPLLTGALFLFILGDNVEDRMGWLPFLFLYLSCGVLAGMAHVLWGKPEGYATLGSAGAVAGVLGAYLVFFPEVAIEMYGLGKVTTVPVYLFACAWVTAAFLIGPGPFVEIVNPAPLSLAGNIAGFGAGISLAVLWRFREEGFAGRSPSSNRS